MQSGKTGKTNKRGKTGKTGKKREGGKAKKKPLKLNIWEKTSIVLSIISMVMFTSLAILQYAKFGRIVLSYIFFALSSAAFLYYIHRRKKEEAGEAYDTLFDFGFLLFLFDNSGSLL